MLKSTQFTRNDYLVVWDEVRNFVRSRPRLSALGLVPALTMAAGTMAFSLAKPAQGEPQWWTIGAGLACLAVVGLSLAAWVLGLRAAVDPRVSWGWGPFGLLLWTWAKVSLGYALKSLLFFLPILVPACVLGLMSGSASLLESPVVDLVTKTGGVLLTSLLGYFYLWSYAAAAVFPDFYVEESQRWAERLSRRTWPWAVGWGLWSLAGTFLVATGWPTTLWESVGSLVSIAFVGVEVVLLGRRSWNPEFGP